MTQFVRWVPKDHAEDAVQAGFFSHNTSALWIFDLDGIYRPGDGVTRDAILIAYNLDALALQKLLDLNKRINFEHESFKGEAAHPELVINKANEQGALGVGKMRQHWSKGHATARYATKAEVAKALRLKIIEVADKYKPKSGWV